ncbi:MAG: hypothetical protein KatS3mg119_0804 [Rhodothalassiaceae bacterium]|nr:MAG: hypothetical protein KatS3mg119_0804 [Rhodothalassiaceae bacterium]
MTRSPGKFSALVFPLAVAACAGGQWPPLAGPAPASAPPAPPPMRLVAPEPVFAFASADEARAFLAALPARLDEWEREIAALERAAPAAGATGAQAQGHGPDWAAAEVRRAQASRLAVALTEAELKLEAAGRALPGEELAIARLAARLARLKATLAAIG